MATGSLPYPTNHLDQTSEAGQAIYWLVAPQLRPHSSPVRLDEPYRIVMKLDETG